jgi:hypothetical protein
MVSGRPRSQFLYGVASTEDIGRRTRRASASGLSAATMNFGLHPRVRAQVVSPCLANQPIHRLPVERCTSRLACSAALDASHGYASHEFFRPSDDIIISSGHRPESRRQPPTSFLRTSADCTGDNLSALFHAGATHGIQERTSAWDRAVKREVKHDGELGKPSTPDVTHALRFGHCRNRASMQI